jgi:hypothetical protein
MFCSTAVTPDTGRTRCWDRNVLKPAYRAAGWRDAGGSGEWTWHSLRHVFCTTVLFTWKLDATDVSRMAGASRMAHSATPTPVR